MSSCFTGGGRAYRLDIDIIKSPSNSWLSNSSSPSSTLSESSNSPLAISTRKPRTPRKRPNQTYNEAAAILSTAYPKIFPTKHLTKPGKFDTKNHPLLFEPSDLLMMPYQIFDTSGYLLNHPSSEVPNFVIDQKFLSSNLVEKQRCQSPGEISSQVNLSEDCDDFSKEGQDFDAESMLDEDVEEGIDSIMGNLSVDNEKEEKTDDFNDNGFVSSTQVNSFCYGYPVGLGFDFGYGMRKQVGAMRNVDEGDWWRFPCVTVADINPKIAKVVEKKKKKKVEIKNLYEATNAVEVGTSQGNLATKSPSCEEAIPQPNVGLLLKLNYDDVLKDWSDKGSPFSGDGPGSDSAGNDVQARLAQIDLFSENGGIREASVQRYKEKRRTRLFSKKIRYQVRKVNADRRPRMKGRFVRTPNSPDTDEQE